MKSMECHVPWALFWAYVFHIEDGQIVVYRTRHASPCLQGEGRVGICGTASVIMKRFGEFVEPVVVGPYLFALGFIKSETWYRKSPPCPSLTSKGGHAFLRAVRIRRCGYRCGGFSAHYRCLSYHFSWCTGTIPGGERRNEYHNAACEFGCGASPPNNNLPYSFSIKMRLCFFTAAFFIDSL